MALFSRRASTPKWIAFEQSKLEGPLQLHATGDFTLAGMTFDQTATLTRCTFNDAIVNKQPGENMLSIDLKNGRRWEFMFTNDKWHMSFGTARSFGLL